MHIFRGSWLFLHFLCLNSMTKRGRSIIWGGVESWYNFVLQESEDIKQNWRKINFCQEISQRGRL